MPRSLYVRGRFYVPDHLPFPPGNRPSLQAELRTGVSFLAAKTNVASLAPMLTYGQPKWCLPHAPRLIGTSHDGNTIELAPSKTTPIIGSP